MPEADAVVAAAAERVFGPNAAVAARYVGLLATTGIERGLLGPREADRIWGRHMFNSAAVAALVPEGVSVVDLGSGAGLPGIPLALARPDLRVTLLEPMARRVAFLDECVAELGLSNVSVVRGRAEDGLALKVDAVAARAVAPLARLAPLALALCRRDGALFALKGAKASEEAAELAAGPGFSAVVHEVSDAVGELATVVEVRRVVRHGRKAP